MRVVAVAEGALVVTSAVWQTTCTVLHDGDETFVVDSPILPAELEALPLVLEQAGWALSGLLATHADWDHVLGRLAFGDASLGVGETTAARLRAEPGAAARELRAFDEEWYVRRPRPLSLGQVQALPVPGRVDLGGSELELHPADGHAVDGVAVWAPTSGVLVVGDYLSPVEVPWVEGSPSAYAATLERLAPLVERASAVVPGHGDVLDAARAGAILREDLAYVGELADGREPELPLARRDSGQRRIHRLNVERWVRA